MHSETPTTKLSWSEIEELTAKLADKVRASGFKPECLIGITIGGLIPLALLAKELDTKDVVTISARSYDTLTKQSTVRITALPDIDLKDKNVLLVDEITDHGTTMQFVIKILQEKYAMKQLKTATLVCKKHSKYRPDHHALETDAWIIFPWEKLEWQAKHTS